MSVIRKLDGRKQVMYKIFFLVASFFEHCPPAGLPLLCPNIHCTILQQGSRSCGGRRGRWEERRTWKNSLGLPEHGRKAEVSKYFCFKKVLLWTIRKRIELILISSETFWWGERENIPGKSNYLKTCRSRHMQPRLPKELAQDATDC